MAFLEHFERKENCLYIVDKACFEKQILNSKFFSDVIAYFVFEHERSTFLKQLMAKHGLF